MRLTATEFELLRLLTANAGRVLTYESLIRQLWNGPDSGDPDRIRTFIKQPRRKLGDDTTPRSASRSPPRALQPWPVAHAAREAPGPVARLVYSR